MVIKMKRRPAIELISDIGFFVFIITEFAFRYSTVSQVGIIVFLSTTYLLCLAKQKIRFSYYFVFYFLFVFYNWLNIKYGTSIVPEASFEMVETLIVNFIILLALYNYAFLRNDPNRIINIFVGSTFIVSVLVLITSLPNLFTQRLGSSIGINSNYIAIVASVSLLMSFYVLLKNRNKLTLPIIFFFLLIILLTGSRKGFLIVFLGVFLLLYLLFPQKRTKYLLISSVGIILLSILIMRIPFFYSQIGIRIENLVKFAFGNDIQEASLKERENLIIRGWNAFKLKPWTGYGLDSFRYVAGGRANYYAHNNFIELLVSGGIIGFLVYYINHIVALIRAFFEGRKGNSVILLMFTITFLLLIMDYGLVSYYGRIYLTPLILTIAFTKLSILKKKV